MTSLLVLRIKPQLCRLCLVLHTSFKADSCLAHQSLLLKSCTRHMSSNSSLPNFVDFLTCMSQGVCAYRKRNGACSIYGYSCCLIKMFHTGQSFTTAFRQFARQFGLVPNSSHLMNEQPFRLHVIACLQATTGTLIAIDTTVGVKQYKR